LSVRQGTSKIKIKLKKIKIKLPNILPNNETTVSARYANYLIKLILGINWESNNVYSITKYKQCKNDISNIEPYFNVIPMMYLAQSPDE